MHSDTFTAGPRTTIAVSGATGFIGRALVDRLRGQGHTVRRLVRAHAAEQAGDIVWDPMRGTLDPVALMGVRAVIHLAGEPIAQRWTAAKKAAIRDSRVQGTSLLARTLAAMSEQPTVFLSGSAVGYYGNRGDELLDEHSAA